MISRFTTHIYKDSLISKSQKTSEKWFNQLIEDIELIMASDEAGHLWSKKNYVSGYTSYGSIDQLNQTMSSFKKLENFIQPHISKYIDHLGYDLTSKDLVMSQCWLNVMPHNAQHTAHIHPLSVISGTFYVQTPPGSSAIKFEDPRLGFFMNCPPLKPKTKDQRFISVQPAEKDIILFESWLRHEVPRNQTQEPRVSISFNYQWDRTLKKN